MGSVNNNICGCFEVHHLCVLALILRTKLMSSSWFSAIFAAILKLCREEDFVLSTIGAGCQQNAALASKLQEITTPGAKKLGCCVKNKQNVIIC